MSFNSVSKLINVNSAVASGSFQAARSEFRDLMSTDLQKRITHTIAFKLEICHYLRTIPGATISGCARYFGISRKQVRYYRDRESHYIELKHGRKKRNLIRPEQIVMRAKYFAQEQSVFKWFLEARSNGKSIFIF